MRIDGGKTLNPGVLREQLIFQRKDVTGQDSYGQDVYTWQTVVSMRGQVTALQGRELDLAQQKWAEAKYKIVTHWYSGLKLEHRIEWWDGDATRYLDMLSIDDIPGTRAYLTILAKEWKQ